MSCQERVLITVAKAQLFFELFSSPWHLLSPPPFPPFRGAGSRACMLRMTKLVGHELSLH